MFGRGMPLRPDRCARGADGLQLWLTSRLRGSRFRGSRRRVGEVGEQFLLSLYYQRQGQLLADLAGAGWANRVGGWNFAATLRADPVQHTHILRPKPCMVAS